MTTESNRRACTRLLFALFLLPIAIASSDAGADDAAILIEHEITFGWANKERPKGRTYIAFTSRAGSYGEREPWSSALPRDGGLSHRARIPMFSLNDNTGSKNLNIGVVLLGVVVVGASLYSLSQQSTECIVATIVTQGYGGC